MENRMERLTMRSPMDKENILYSPKDEIKIVEKLAMYEELEDRITKEFGSNLTAFELMDMYLKQIETQDGEMTKGFRILTNDDAKLYDKWKVDRMVEAHELLIKIPCKIGDTVYDIDFGKVIPCMVTGYSMGAVDEDDEDEYSDELKIHYCGAGIENCCGIDEFGKTVFLSREIAKEALAR
jgi:hypothetical protein